MSRSNIEKFVELCKRLRINLSFTQPDSRTLLHWMIEVAEDKDISHCLSVLISNGLDPCAVCEGYLTPTLVAFFENRLDPWFTVLRQLGVSVEAVATHASGLLTASAVGDMISRIVSEPISLNRRHSCLSTINWINGQHKGWSKFEPTKQLRAALIEAFERQGCYLIESDDRGSMVTYKTSSSVDFKPSTVYDPERAKQDVRRRTDAQKNPQ